MNLLHLPAPIHLSPTQTIAPGKYISPEMVAMQLLLLLGDGTMEPLTEIRRFDPALDWNGKRLLIQRVGGFGDLVLMTPVLREIKRRWPKIHIGFSAMADYSVVFDGLGLVDEVLPFPVAYDAADSYDAWIFYENAVEKNERAKVLHMTELFGEIAGITKIPDLLPAYKVRPTEMIWANESFPRGDINGPRRIAIQVGASARCRRYHLLGDLLTALVLEKNFEVFLLGVETDLPALRGKRLAPGIKNLTESGISFRQSCAVANTADCFIGPDSAILHVAGALGIPAVGLYGPFPWKLRTAHSPSVHAIQGTGGCSPCFHHDLGTMKNHFPAHCPSGSKGVCQVLGTISPERIIQKVEKIMRRIEPMKTIDGIDLSKPS